MQARVISFRRGLRTQKMNQLLLEIPGAATKEAAAKYIGKKVVWTSSSKTSKKTISGVITAAHGRNGVLRARFSRGLPGQVLGKKIEIAA